MTTIVVIILIAFAIAVCIGIFKKIAYHLGIIEFCDECDGEGAHHSRCSRGQ